MDIFTAIFVAGLCAIAFFLTMTVRREFRTQERHRRQQELESRPPAANPDQPHSVQRRPSALSAD